LRVTGYEFCNVLELETCNPQLELFRVFKIKQMKNISIKVLLLLCVIFTYSACIEDPEEILEPNGAVPVVTAVTDGFYDLINTSSVTPSFTLGVSGVGVSSVTVQKSYNGSAPVTHGTVSSFPMDISISFNDMVNGLSVNTDELEVGDNFDITFVCNTTDGRALTSATKVSIPVSCVSALAGMYDVTTTYGYHDFLPDFNPNTTTAEIVEVSAGVYEIADFSGGLYSVGPYSSAYGTTGLPAQFSDICGEISWANQADPWGAMIPDADGVNSVDPATGVITISWYCEG